MDAIESLVQTDPTIQWIVINDEMIKTLDTRLNVEKVMIGPLCLNTSKRFTKKTQITN